ncbi:cupin domain-containing protein [Halobacillus karajensis]|uniref:Cupin type-2 domain-containing protein n=1 Tax=Halobacillus karajensis TaxID=195088 RepID=A0A024P6G1_9BACI|nr:cupin domain-containing protein [Halobacillus karajensis]CDQ17805.1 hypothetical protein BN982_00043 [Halobacillus karajensis]CDQ24211.1 hypothetical protein BN983_02483 [Halobacillus karajensis]CDQ29540.1 hypothetical protein BN981_03923 [Halobacillus karajensis]
MHNSPQGVSYPNSTLNRNALEMNDIFLDAVKKKAKAVRLFNALGEAAPDKKHEQEILKALENEKRHLNHFTHLYTSFTGTEPEYEREEPQFQTYEEGLREGYDAGLEEFEKYRNVYSKNGHNQWGDVFYRACHDKAVTTNRLVALSRGERQINTKDYGKQPFVVDMEEAAKKNGHFRTALWTGNHLQITLMSIPVGDDIGLEVHPDVDQFLRIEEGQGLVQMGDEKYQLNFQQRVSDDSAIMVPAGTWHNLINTGPQPLKLYSIYAPPEHSFGTVHHTKADTVLGHKDHNEGRKGIRE